MESMRKLLPYVALVAGVVLALTGCGERDALKKGAPSSTSSSKNDDNSRELNPWYTPSKGEERQNKESQISVANSKNLQFMMQATAKELFDGDQNKAYTACDLNGDGRVTLEEARAYRVSRTGKSDYQYSGNTKLDSRR